MRRKVYHELLSWKNEKKRKLLYLKGVYGCGKSNIVKRFAAHNYKSYAIIDLSNVDYLVKECITEDCPRLEPFFISVSAVFRISLYRHESLIVFDEISALKGADKFIKRLAEDGRYDYIAIDSFPDSKVLSSVDFKTYGQTIEMNPLDFEEFMWAIGKEDLFSNIKRCFDLKIPLAYTNHRKAMECFENYVVIGGLPLAVNTFVEHFDIFEIDRIRKQHINELWQLLQTRYPQQKERIKIIVDNIPKQLSGHDKQFRINSVDAKLRFKNYKKAFEILCDIGICNISNKVEDISVEEEIVKSNTVSRLNFNIKESGIKVYFGDTGILLSRLKDDNSVDENNKNILLGDFSLNNGMIIENCVAQMLKKPDRKLMFYSNIDPYHRVNNMSINFLIADGTRFKPIVIKADNYKLSSSIDKIKNRYDNLISEKIVLSSNDIMIRDGITYLPFYMAMML